MSPSVLLRWAVRDSAKGLTASWIGGLGYQAGLILLPWCLGRALDEGITPGDRGPLLYWAAATLIVSVALTGAEFAMRWWATLAGVRTGNRLLLRLSERVLGWDSATAHRFSAGDLVTRGTRDVEQITIWISTVPSLASGVLGFLTVLVVVATLDPMLAIVGLSTVPLLIAVNLWYPRRYEGANAALSAAHGARADAVEDLLSASTAVRGLGGEQVLIERHHEVSATVRDRTLALARIAAGWAANAPFVPWLATAIGVAFGGLAVLDGRFSVGGLVSFASWMTLLGRQVMMLTFRFGQLGDAWTAAGRIETVLSANSEMPEKSLRELAAGSLTASGVTVRLEGREPLRLPDFRVDPGEMVAVVGPVGTGKSTLLRLLARLADPATGAIRYGGTDLRDVAIADVRDTITIVGQRPLLLSGTIAENLRLGRAELTDEQLRDACRIAGILEHIESLPEGFATVVGERGSTVSGGQLQRLALARGLLRRARVLLLDDVTSAVDARTEQRILDGLQGLDVTIVFATSRTAVRDRADRVVDLGVHEGELVSHG
ncbi:ABC transporter ATP-binding protein [Paractinoplanes atraurantiacus]|uniref:ATP-binding cassette, subfamily B n=1 Tax=Paractinoplanes atraurantiacus TaxID=1036182 RepID=A0A285KK45_9ACTN|nr:ABC transporter ATP-binding protein [Actinoplanes atraurantiacus]SNY72990.1 ATP-binding cassette, subfamily B [Actinoplanes atraurantiacus]